MSQSPPSVRTDDGHLIVEAPTAEAALELVAQRLGTRARIAGVERVRRGGVGGFFARELVQVTATAGEEPPADTAADAPQDENAVDRLLRRISERDDPFATVLQQELARGDGDAGHAPAGVSAPDVSARAGDPPDMPATGRASDAPATAGDAPSRPAAATPSPSRPASTTQPSRPASMPPPSRPAALPRPVATPATDAGAPLPGTPVWTVHNLARVGLPPLIPEDRAVRLAPGDDVGWTHALASSLQPLCGPLPSGPVIVAGPAAERLAGPLDLPLCWPGQPAPPESFVAPISGRYSDREWLASVRGRRALHVVVGGPGWRGLLFDEPAVLSHLEEAMTDAITVAVQLGIPLGYTCHGSGAVTRTSPVDLAVAIRRMLPAHS